jgi:hypothetical protein
MVPLLLQCCVVSPIPHWRQTKNRYRRSVYESTPWEALVLRIYSTGKTTLDSLSVKDPRHNTLGPEILMPSQPHLSSPEHSLQGAARQPGGPVNQSDTTWAASEPVSPEQHGGKERCSRCPSRGVLRHDGGHSFIGPVTPE